MQTNISCQDSQTDTRTEDTAPSTCNDPADREFKNFHQRLCERFGYVHDDRDWKRDQVSLIEWIAGQTAGSESAKPAADVFEFVLDVLDSPPDRCGVMIAIPLARKMARTVLEEYRRNAIAP